MKMTAANVRSIWILTSCSNSSSDVSKCQSIILPRGDSLDCMAQAVCLLAATHVPRTTCTATPESPSFQPAKELHEVMSMNINAITQITNILECGCSSWSRALRVCYSIVEAVIEWYSAAAVCLELVAQWDGVSVLHQLAGCVRPLLTRLMTTGPWILHEVVPESICPEQLRLDVHCLHSQLQLQIDPSYAAMVVVPGLATSIAPEHTGFREYGECTEIA